MLGVGVLLVQAFNFGFHFVSAFRPLLAFLDGVKAIEAVSGGPP